MKYKVGNKVKINTLDWYNANKDKIGVVRLTLSSNSTYNFVEAMTTLCGEVVTIGYVDEHRNFYRILEDVEEYYWTDEMIEGLVEEKFITANGLQFNQKTSLEKEMEWNLPDGYIFKDENGNEINTTKIILERKKSRYPKSFVDCCAILYPNDNFQTVIQRVKGHKCDLFFHLQKLYICRDAYWQMASEEMGKPWKPDWTNEDQLLYGLYDELKFSNINPSQFVFPTEEMRDDFLNNFKNEIEQCK